MASKEWKLVILAFDAFCDECGLNLVKDREAYYDMRRELTSCYSHVKTVERQ